jgi:F0F1-type ATP synthase membrane subunit c/vacuolar-type H+-ATPase subunit K
MIPRTIVAVWSGTKAQEIKQLLENPNEGAFQQILLIGLILVSAIGLFVVINRAISRVT